MGKVKENKHLPEQLRSIRRILDLTQSEMAFSMGFSLGYYQRVENGTSSPTYDKVMDGLDALGVARHILNLSSDNIFGMTAVLHESTYDDEKESLKKIEPMSLERKVSSINDMIDVVASKNYQKETIAFSEFDNLKRANESLRADLDSIPKDIREAIKTADKAEIDTIRAVLGLLDTLDEVPPEEESSG